MAIQMTRAEYEAKYGSQAPVASSPVKVKMSRAQYEQKYGLKPGETTSDVKGGFLGDVLTGSTQKFGRSIGESLAAPFAIKKYKQAVETHGEVTGNIVKALKEARAAGKDTTRLMELLQEHEAAKPDQSQFLGAKANELMNMTPGKAALKVAGEGLGTAVEALGFGAVKGIKGIGLANKLARTADEAADARKLFNALPLGKKLGTIAKDTAKTAGALAPVGYAADVSQNLQEGEENPLTPGLGTALSVGIPAGVGLFRGARSAIADKVLPIAASNLSGVPEEAYTRLRTGDAKSFLGKVTPAGVLDDTRATLASFNKAAQEEFGENSKKIFDEFANNRVGFNEREAGTLNKIARRFGFADRLPKNLQNLSAKESIDLIEELNAVGPVKEFDDPLVKSYKLALADLKKSFKGKAVNSFGGEGGSFDKLYKNYSAKKKVVNNVQSIIGKVGVGGMELTPTQKTTAQNRLMAAFKEDRTAYIDALMDLEKKTGTNILDKVAAAHLTPFTPKTLRTPSAGAIGYASDLLSLVTLPLSSPRLGSWLIGQVGGYGPGIAEKLLNLSPTVRKAIYDAVTKEHKPFAAAVAAYVPLNFLSSSTSPALSKDATTKTKPTMRNTFNTTMDNSIPQKSSKLKSSYYKQ